MLLKTITLTNFRQFNGTQTVTFSENRDRNVTVIMGENGSGKTTIAQAFKWCLYNKTDFSDPIVLSNAVRSRIRPEDEVVSRVEIVLVHAGTEYTITRSQKFRISGSGVLKPSPVKATVVFKGADGQQHYVKENMIESKINEILPFELSGYFFFDGERITNMSRSIQKNKGNNTFGEAVQRLLGLDSFKAAMKHLKEGSAGYNVIGFYNKALSESDDSGVTRISKRREELQKEYDATVRRLEELEIQIPELEDAINELNAIIERNKDGERIRSEIKRLEGQRGRNDVVIGDSWRKILNTFRANYRNYFSCKLMADAIETVSTTEQFDKGIPKLHKDTVEYLIHRGVCICGTSVPEGSAEYMQLKKMIEYSLPNSIGTAVKQFASDCKTSSRNVTNLYNAVKDIMQDLTERQAENEEISEEIASLENRLQSFEEIGNHQLQVKLYRTDKQKKEAEKAKLLERKGQLATDINRCDTEMHELAMKSSNNRKIELYKAYALRMYDLLKDEYDQKEANTRRELEQNVNEIYSEIYNSEMNLHLDEKYNIETTMSGFSNVETGTAQGISIIFAFIAGVIRMAKHYNTDEYLSTEPYPLVMDAPLSAFDKSRIKSVCETLPNIAEQVIIFIKDTDGDIAEEHLSDKIGKRYNFVKINSLETHIE